MPFALLFVLLFQMCGSTNPPQEHFDLVYDLSKGEVIQKGIQPYYEAQAAQTEKIITFEIANAYLYHNKIFVPYLSAEKKSGQVRQYPDQPYMPYSDLEGNKCFCMGSITGIGTGECAGMLQKGVKKTLSVKVIR